MTDTTIDITPDPGVLVALTQTPIKPLDALCELVDNAVDAYYAAEMQGVSVPRREIHITIPKPAQVKSGVGTISIRDHGAGLDETGLANALRAGYAGKNRYDALGLFGMGFNIAAGKLGRRTVISTSCRGTSEELRVVYDLTDIIKQQTFNAPITRIAKSEPQHSGTTVEVMDWWPEGHQNANLARDLARITGKKLREQLGRRYASLLRDDSSRGIRMYLNGDPIAPFHHCVWDDSRYVERKRARIPAVFRFDEEVARTRRCIRDSIEVPPGSDECEHCGGTDFREVVERVHGWVGIQRYDHKDEFGIDVIRNGRAILVGEREAFFKYRDDNGDTTLEYPVDDVNGRIVGEVHLDHVPVHFTKEDFERTTDEWARAMEYVRGKGLREGRWEDGYSNPSPVSQLVRAYGRVRNFGPQDLYPAQWDPNRNKPGRLPRDQERELIRRFRDRDDGYVDDTRWYALVENGAVPPVLDQWSCPECMFEQADAPEECPGCGALIDPKKCVACNEPLLRSAGTCGACSAEQFSEPATPWACLVCGSRNDPAEDACLACGSARGTPNPLAPEHLHATSTPVPSMSRTGLSVVLAGGKQSVSIDLGVLSADLLPTSDGARLPLVSSWQGQRIEVFVDFSHAAFQGAGLAPMELVATEVANYWLNYHAELQGDPGHTIGALTAKAVLALRDDDPSGLQLADRIKAMFDDIAAELEDAQQAGDYFRELPEAEMTACIQSIGAAGRLKETEALTTSGKYLVFASAGTLIGFFEYAPEEWFGTVWTETLQTPDALTSEVSERIRQQRIDAYARCLADCADYQTFPTTDQYIVARALASYEFLSSQRA